MNRNLREFTGNENRNAEKNNAEFNTDFENSLPPTSDFRQLTNEMAEVMRTWSNQMKQLSNQLIHNDKSDKK